MLRQKPDRKSQSEHPVFIRNQVVSWSSRKQTCVASSLTEAEYVSMGAAGRSALYFRNLLRECQFSTSYVNIVGDSLSALTLGARKSVHQRTKHIDVRYHFIRNLVNDKILKLIYINTRFNYADMLTKACDSITLKHLINLLLH